MISAFVVHCLYLLNPNFKTLDSHAVSVTEQADLSLTWSQTPEDRFSRDVAQMQIVFGRRDVDNTFEDFSMSSQQQNTNSCFILLCFSFFF